METEVPKENPEDTADNRSDWDSRTLCSDGNCIGVIGPDGHCKECGLKYEGEVPEMDNAEEEEDVDTSADEIDSAGATTEIIDDAAAVVDDDEWENRVLCSDGNCIGVIGPDGKCKECGKPLK